MTIGQYLQPYEKRLPVERYVTPEEFAEWKKIGEAMGFKHVESSPSREAPTTRGNRQKAARKSHNCAIIRIHMNETDKQSAIEILNKIMELELAGVVRYTHYSLMVFGYNRYRSFRG
jgi:hypothetical protein